MGRFDFNPNNVDIGFPIFPKDTYRMRIGEPKAYENEAEGDRAASFGVRYLLKIVGGPFDGKPYMASFNLAEDYGNQNAMRFLVASMGIKPTDEGVKEFRDKYGNKDWSCDGAARTCGEGWHIVKDREVLVDLDKVEIKKGERKGEMGQGFPTFNPAT